MILHTMYSLLMSTAVAGLTFGEITPKRGFKVGVAGIYPEYQLDVTLTPVGQVEGWTNILRVTATNKNNGFGARVPAMFFHSGSNKLHVCTGCDGNPNACFTTNDLPTGVASLVSVVVGKGEFSVSIDSKKVASGKCVVPYTPTGTGVFYASDPYYKAAAVEIGSISYTQFGKGDGDLGMRFNKMTGLDMRPSDYPLDMDLANKLRLTDAVSVIHQQDCGAHCLDIKKTVDKIGGPPTHPTTDTNSPFWEEMREVVKRQMDRKNDVDPRKFMPLPKIWAHYDIHQVAEAVHDEFPGVHHSALIAQLLSEGAKCDRTIIPAQSKVDFLRGPVVLSQLNGWAISEVGPTNFGAKWMFGRARPEEVAFAIAQGKIGVQDGVPSDIVQNIKKMKLSDAREFTAYTEGSPVHPSWPAMHSAASSGALWIATVMDLTEEQLCEVKKVDYAVSYGRTVAGVHYSTDNSAGLNIGQEIVAEKLPKHLSERYGADMENVQAKIASLRHDWATFKDTKCFGINAECAPCSTMVPKCPPECRMKCIVTKRTCTSCPIAVCDRDELQPPISFRGTTFNEMSQEFGL